MQFKIRFIHENAFENVVCEMAAILSRPQYVNEYYTVYFQSFLEWTL